MKFKVVVHEDEEDSGWFNVSCPSLRGCHSQGRSIEEALKNIKEAIELYLQPDKEIKVTQRGEKVVEVTV